jgi:N-acetylglutamate synthase-like GNAT family acetyltransferase
VEDEGTVIGCGGWYLDGAVAVLSWGMVRRSRHREGVGRLLLNERLKMIRQNEHVKSVRVRTTSSVQGFFERAGFKVVTESVTGVVDEMPLVELTLTF